MGNAPSALLDESKCPAGRSTAIPSAPGPDATHFCKKGARLYPPFPDGTEMISLGMGCFWCSENLFMNMKGVYSTQSGYQGGATKNPTYVRSSPPTAPYLHMHFCLTVQEAHQPTHFFFAVFSANRYDEISTGTTNHAGKMVTMLCGLQFQ